MASSAPIPPARSPRLSASFDLPLALTIEALEQQFARLYRVRHLGSDLVIRTYYDSFDWRVFSDGGLIEQEEAGHSTRLIWRSLDGRAVHASWVVDRFPRFARDLPSGRIRELLEPVLGARALLPVVTVRCRTRSFALLDKSEKTVLRLATEECRLDDAASTAIRRVYLLGLKGYVKAFDKGRRLCEDELGLPPASGDRFLTALAAAGREPGDYSSRPDIQLSPDWRTDRAARLILLSLLATLQTNEEGVRGDLDPEFLHDFRVAIRRTRAALSQIKQVFPARLVQRYRDEFAWLGQATGRARDADVYLLAFDSYQASLPEAMREYLEPLRAYLQREKTSAHRELVATLGSVRYRRLIRGWSRFLRRELPRRPPWRNAMCPALGLASKRILRLYREVLTLGADIGPETPAPALHEVRKSCKKLRYLMEFFCSLYPEEQMLELVKALKGFQDSLGECQDLAVQIDRLQRFGVEIREEGAVAGEGTLAIGTLIGILLERQRRLRDEFSARFTHFAGRETQARYEALCGERETAPE